MSHLFLLDWNGPQIATMTAMNVPSEVSGYYHKTLRYYDASLADRGDLPFWTSVARRWHPERILEIGCGSGRVTTVLARVAPVTAVDLVLEMLVIAAKKSPETGFLAADMRALPVTTRFDLVILADDPMSHLITDEDRTSALRSISGRLAPEGRIVLEGLYRPLPGDPLTRSRSVSAGGMRFDMEERWIPIGGGPVWNATYRYKEAGRTREVSAKLRSWTTNEIDRLPENGLRIEQLWGGFDERPFQSDATGMILVAQPV
jgi:SAM-dependent methyltransferase